MKSDHREPYLDAEQVGKLSQQARKKLDSGDFDNALRLTREIQNIGEHRLISNTVSGLLIDIGSDISREEIIREGVDLLEGNFKTIIYDEKYTATAHYNLANGYYALFHLKMMKDPYASCFKKTELNTARTHYQRALESGPPGDMLISQIWVNLGNCFDYLGRVIDALECYEKALGWKPDHGMALGNKGVGLIYYSSVAGEHQDTFLIEAYSLISQALWQGVHAEATLYFEKRREEIKNRFIGRQNLLDSPPQYPGHKIKARSKMERFLVTFCMENKLYLNICNYCQKCDASIGDTALIKRMIVPISVHNQNDWPKDEPYLRLSAYLNQIKQDYVTARFLLSLSRYKGLNLDFVDKHVKLIDTLDYSIHNIYIELVKVSFKSFYSILDKIAYFLNDYLELKIKTNQIYFRTVWYENSQNKDKVIRERIQDTRNHSLNALFDLHRDFEEGTYKHLRLIRDALTHRFVSVRMFQELEENENMSEDALVSRTLELAKLVRNAILYLLYFVYIEESKKEVESEGLIVPMFARVLPDNLKNYR